MGEVRVLLVGEGRHELGGCRDTYAPAEALPPLAVLVRRLTGAEGTVRFFCRRGKDVRNYHRGKMASGWGKKAYSAIWSAAKGTEGETFDAVVIVVDRDGPKNGSYLPEMQEGRDEYEDPHFPCAIGVAVEMFDAWMIADANAILAAGGDHTKAPTPPEKIKNPKDVADAIFGTHGGTGLGPKYAVVAENVDLDHLSRICSEGFAPFAKEVKERIAPMVGKL